MQPQLPLAKYKFIFQAIDPVTLPAFPDPLWRSVFGLALRQLSCIADKQDCNGCMLRHQCDYSFCIASPDYSQKKNGIIKEMKNLPPPHVFSCRVGNYSTSIPRGAKFSAGIVLIGNGNERLPAIIRAMLQAGILGLGKKRSKFRLLEVLQTEPGSLERVIMSNQKIILAGVPELPLIPEPPEILRFSFHTPFLLSGNIKMNQKFNGTRLLMQIIRRISSLHEAYTGTSLETDLIYLKSLAETHPALVENLTFEKGYSYSFDQMEKNKKFMAMRGEFIISLEGREELWPWIYLGQWLNVGKQASKGFGRYSVAAMSTR